MCSDVFILYRVLLSYLLNLVSHSYQFIMSSSSGGDSRSGQRPNITKMKTNLNVGHNSDPDWNTQTSKKNRKSNHKPSSPISPSLQQIILNPPSLISSEPAFNYNNVLSPSDNVPMDSLTDHNTNDICPTTIDVGSSSLSDNQPSPSDIITTTDNQHNYNDIINPNLRLFSPDYTGPVIILAECIDLGKNLGNWHPLKAAKFFSSNFSGITCIKPASAKKVKITFDSVVNGNICLNSNILSKHGFTAIIPSTLIYSYGIIKIDNSFSEEDFRDGLLTSIPVEAFKRISVKKDGVTIQTRIVELKFLAPKIPSHISIYNMLFNVLPSIRSPVQCNRCLRFGHTQKFCRSNPRCSHCGNDNHSIDVCPLSQATDPKCLFCNLSHLATDRSCKEWSFQSEIKKIMATENISYREALDFKKNNFQTTAFKYSEIVNRQSSPSADPTVPTSYTHEDFPNLTSNHHFFNSGKKKKPKIIPSTYQKHFSLPHDSPLSLPNGSYLNTYSQNSHPPSNNSNDFSWVHPLSLKLSESLINSPALLSPFTPSTLQNLIESSLHSLLSIPKFNSSN